MTGTAVGLALSTYELARLWLVLRESDPAPAEAYRQALLERLDGRVDYAVASLILDHHPWANAPEVALGTEALSEDLTNPDFYDFEWCLAVAKEVQVMGGGFILSARRGALTFSVRLAASSLPRPPELADVAEVYRHATSRKAWEVVPHRRAADLVQDVLAR
jgi:hypothetical protein